MKVHYEPPKNDYLNNLFEIFIETLSYNPLQTHIVRKYTKDVPPLDTILLIHDNDGRLNKFHDHFGRLMRGCLGTHTPPTKKVPHNIIRISLPNILKHRKENFTDDSIDWLVKSMAMVYITWMHELRHIAYGTGKSVKESRKLERKVLECNNEFPEDDRFFTLLYKAMTRRKKGRDLMQQFLLRGGRL